MTHFQEALLPLTEYWQTTFDNSILLFWISWLHKSSSQQKEAKVSVKIKVIHLNIFQKPFFVLTNNFRKDLSKVFFLHYNLYQPSNTEYDIGDITFYINISYIASYEVPIKCQMSTYILCSVYIHGPHFAYIFLA